MLDNNVRFYMNLKGKLRAELETRGTYPTSLLPPLQTTLYKAVPVILG